MKHTSYDQPFIVNTALAVLAGVLLVLLVGVDAFGLLINDRDPARPTLFTTLLAFAFLGIAGMALFRRDAATTLPPYEQLVRAVRFMLIADVILAVSVLLLPDDLSLHHWGIVSLAATFLVAPAAVVLQIRRLYWVDTLLRLRRTTHTEKVRSLVVPAMIALLLLNIFLWPNTEEVGAVVLAVTAVAALVLFGTFSNVSWIIALTRSQKWKGFGLCTLGATSSMVMFALMSNGNMEASLQALLPGTEQVAALIFLCSAVYFVRVAFSLMLTLPSAGIIDRQVSEKHSLSMMGSILTSVENLDDLLARVLGVATGVVRSSVAWIDLRPDDSGRPATACMYMSEQQFDLVRKDKALAELGASLRQPLYVEHINERPELRMLYESTHSFLRSLIVVPLEVEGRSIGTLYVGHPAAFAFEHESVMLFSAVAGTASLAIQNHRLFSRLLSRERYERELFLAREIQRKLLPQDYTVPDGFDIAGYTSPAFEVGGDYYDFVTLKNGRFCAVIGDVSGKGMSAAMYTAELKGVVLAVGADSESPADLLCRINRAMYGSLDRQLFITLAAVELDSERDTIRIARAGHNPFLLRGENGTMFVTPKGIGVGLVGPAMFDRALELREVPMAPGDICVMYTDGINEAINGDREEYGNERLGAILTYTPERRAELILGDIVRDAAEFGGGAPQQDDMTLLVISRTGQRAEGRQSVYERQTEAVGA